MTGLGVDIAVGFGAVILVVIGFALGCVAEAIRGRGTPPPETGDDIHTDDHEKGGRS